VFLLVLALVSLGGSLLVAQSSNSSHGFVVVPDSTVEHSQDRGVRAHTNHLIWMTERPDAGKPGGGGPKGETPASIRAVYSLPPSGGSGVIAIVDAYHYPTADADLDVFSTQFGLPHCTVANGCFKVVYASGSQPRSNCGWAQEAALDIEWAHAMAPSAKIVLVEAASNSFADLFAAVDVATAQVTTGNATGNGEVSMSWSGGEFSSEASNDGHFLNNGVIYFASSGDTGGVNGYPSVSPYVVSAGGTTIHRTNGVFTSETAWSGSGGGPSKYETKLAYQSGVAGTDPTQRSAPDFSFDADPASGVSVYDSTSCQGASGWLVFGGTSVSSPSMAGIVNLAGHVNSSSNTVGELTTVYANRANTADFRDIISGTAGGFSAGVGYDFITGVGSGLGLNGK
jgi:subtilase family serine protease